MLGIQKQDLGPFLTNLFGDRYLHEVNHLVFNKIGSKEYYRKYFGGKFLDKNTLFVLVGADSGLLLKYLSSVQIGSGSRVLVAEAPEVLERLNEIPDCQDLPPNVYLASADSWQGLLEQINFLAYSYLDQIIIMESVGAADGHFAKYKELYRDVRQALEDLNWRVKANLGSKTFFLRQLENLAENRHPAFCLKNRFAGKTAAILGAGPSLDEAIPWLLDQRENLMIVAVSRVSRRLLEVGLRPDIVVSADPEYASFRVSREMLKLDQKVILVQANHAHPHLISSWLGRQLYMGPRLPWNSILNKENFEIHGPTVTNSAIEMAGKMGFSRLVLCGVDLCHSLEGYSHSQGNTERDFGPSINHLFHKVVTNSGEIAESPQGYFGAAVALAEQASELKKMGCQLINMSAGAVKIEEVTYQPVEEIKVEALNLSIQDLLNEIYPEDSIEWRKSDLQRVLDEIRTIRVRLRKIEMLAAEALDCNDGLFGRNNKKADFKYKIKMDKIEKKLNREFSDLVPLVKHYGFDLFSRVVRPDGTVEWTDDEIEITGRQYYEAYLFSSQELGLELEKTERRLVGRLEELSAEPNLVNLFQQWSEDKIQGPRSWYWLKKYGNNHLPEDVSAEMLERERAVEAFINGQVVTVTREDFFQFDKIKTKAVLFFRKGDPDGLRRLQSGIEKYGGVDGVQELMCLVTGYLAEIDENFTAALNAYQQLIDDEVGLLTEEVLSRIVSVSMKLEDYENVLLALECLAEISPSYQVSYAEMLKLSGKKQEASQVYSEYLTKAPGDLLAMLKLGQLYAEINAFDAAEMAFKYVLEADPGNDSAKVLLKELEANNAK